MLIDGVEVEHRVGSRTEKADRGGRRDLRGLAFFCVVAAIRRCCGRGAADWLRESLVRMTREYCGGRPRSWRSWVSWAPRGLSEGGAEAGKAV